MAVVASKLAVANNFPDGDQAQDRTVRVCVSSKVACISFLNSNIMKLTPNPILNYTPNHHIHEY